MDPAPHMTPPFLLAIIIQTMRAHIQTWLTSTCPENQRSNFVFE